VDDNYDFEDDWGQQPLADDEHMPHVGVLAYHSFEEARVAVAELIDELRLIFAETDEDYGLGGQNFIPQNVHAEINVDDTLDCFIVFTPYIDGQMKSNFSVGQDQSVIVFERDKYGLVALEHMRRLFDYLLDDIDSFASKVDFSELEQVFGEGERPLDIMNREGLPLENPFNYNSCS
jgi:hypothetical protein